MNFVHFSVFCPLGVAIGAAPLAAVADAATTTPAKPHIAKTKPKLEPVDPGALGEVQFSDPKAPLGRHPKTEKTLAPPSSSAASEPVGGPSFGVKWHAESHVNDVYWQPWAPNGQGESVQAGVKFGF